MAEEYRAERKLRVAGERAAERAAEQAAGHVAGDAIEGAVVETKKLLPDFTSLSIQMLRASEHFTKAAEFLEARDTVKVAWHLRRAAYYLSLSSEVSANVGSA